MNGISFSLSRWSLLRGHRAIVEGSLSLDSSWFRGPSGAGWSIRRTRPLFSERNGYRKVIKLPFGYRAVRLEANR